MSFNYSALDEVFFFIKFTSFINIALLYLPKGDSKHATDFFFLLCLIRAQLSSTETYDTVGLQKNRSILEKKLDNFWLFSPFFLWWEKLLCCLKLLLMQRAALEKESLPTPFL